MRHIKIGFGIGFILLALATKARGSGFRIIDQSAAATGQVDAFVAQADNPSAIYYNPAGLTQLSGTQIEAGANIVMLRTEHKNPLGDKEDMLKKEHYPFFGYVVSDLGTEQWRFGIGVNSPFGLATDWSETGFSRYVATYTEMNTININPTVAYQILPGLSVAVGLDYLYSEQELKRQINYGAYLGHPGEIAYDGTFSADGDGDGWGYNIGILYQPHPRHSFGLAFRSKIDVGYDGDAKIYDIPPGLPGSPKITSDASSDICFPANLTLGYAFRPVDKLKIEFDIDWTRWSTFDSLTLDFDSPLIPDEIIERDWKNALFYALGIEYQVVQQWIIRGGAGYVESPIPEKTFDTTIPRPDQWAFSLGLGYRGESLRIDLAYLGAFGKKDVANNVGADVGANLDGEYKTQNHVIALDCGYAF